MATLKKNDGHEQPGLMLVLLVVITTTVVVLAAIAICLVSALMVTKQLSHRMEAARRKHLKKILPKLSPPPTSPPPAPPLPECSHLTLSATSRKDHGFHERLTSSLSSSLTASLLWWLPQLKGSSRLHATFFPREYETPIVTKIKMEALERSQNHYDVPMGLAAATTPPQSKPTTCVAHSGSHHYEEVA